MTIWQRIKAAARDAVSKIPHPRQFSYLEFLLPNTTIDFAKHVGEGLGSNVFMSVLLWIWRASLESRWALVSEDADGNDEFDVTHDVVKLLRKPNPFTTGVAMRLAMFISWFADGNVYLLKARDKSGRVRQLWYVPHWMIEPKWKEDDPTDFISYYCYKPGGTAQEEELLPTEVVHLKHGVDPRNVRKGFSMLKMLLREVFNDDEAANFVAALLLNGGVPGIIISPKDANAVGSDDLKATKEYIKVHFGRSKRGEPLALGGPTDVQEFGYDPQKMDLSVVRNVAEERVCAALGLPSGVVGFGSGNEQTKVGATLVELHRIAWVDCIIPNQEMLAEELTHALAEDFKLGDEQRIGWDRRKVRALAEDAKKLAEQMDIGIRGGWVMISEGREALELPVLPAHKIFLRPFSSLEVAEDGTPIEPTVGPNAPQPEGEEGEEGDKPGEDGKPEPDGPVSPSDKPRNKPPKTPPPPPPKHLKNARRLSRAQGAILRGLDAVQRKAETMLAKRMNEFFDDMGKLAAREYLKAVEAKALEDEIIVNNMFAGMRIPVLRSNLRGILANSYVQVFHDTRAVLGKAGLGTSLDDQIELDILTRGGTRAGMVDLSERARQKAMEIIREGREEGKNSDAIARELEKAVPAGRFDDPRDRAKMIARTEGRVARSESAVAIYRNSPGIRAVRIIDGRLGDTDEDCQEVNGQEVTFEQAEAFIADEHPNGTRDFVPVFDREASA